MKQFTIVPSKVSHETIEALRYLLHEAERGELIGIAYTAMLKRRFVIMDSAGEAYRNPIFALGMLGMLCSDTQERAKEQGELNRG